MLDSVSVTALKQVAGRHRIVTVVLQRIGDRFRYDGVCRKMHDGTHLVLAQDRGDEFYVAGIPDDEFAMQDRVAEAFAKVVEDNDLAS